MVFSSIFTSNNNPQNILEQNNTYLNTNNYIFQGSDNDNTNNNLFNKTLYELGIHKAPSEDSGTGGLEYTNLSSSSNFTIMMWLYLDINGLSSNETYYNVLGTGTLNISVYNNINNNNGNIFFGFQYLSSNDSLNVGGFENKSWQHIACVYEYPYQKIYINGILKGINSVGFFARDHNNSDRFVKLGKPYTVTDTNKRWIGQISNIFIFDKALIQYEIDNYKNNFINNVYYEPPNLLYELPLQFDLIGDNSYNFGVNSINKFHDPGVTLKDANNIFLLNKNSFIQITGMDDICYNLTGRYTITYTMKYNSIEIIKERYIYIYDVSINYIKVQGNLAFIDQYYDAENDIYVDFVAGPIYGYTTDQGYDNSIVNNANKFITYYELDKSLWWNSYSAQNFIDILNSANIKNKPENNGSTISSELGDTNTSDIYLYLTKGSWWIKNNDDILDYNKHPYYYYNIIKTTNIPEVHENFLFSDSEVDTESKFNNLMNYTNSDFYLTSISSNSKYYILLSRDSVSKDYSNDRIHIKIDDYNNDFENMIHRYNGGNADGVLQRFRNWSVNTNNDIYFVTSKFLSNISLPSIIFDQTPLYIEVSSNSYQINHNDNITIQSEHFEINRLTLEISSNVVTNIIGTYIVEYTITDPYYNIITISNEIIVRDTTPPILTLLGDNPHLFGAFAPNYIDPGFTAFDSYLGDISNLVISNASNIINLNQPGDYIVTYSVTDNFNTTTITRTVTIYDPPYVTIEKFSDLFNIATKTVTVKGSYAASDINYNFPDDEKDVLSEYAALSREEMGGGIYNSVKEPNGWYQHDVNTIPYNYGNFDLGGQGNGSKGVMWYNDYPYPYDKTWLNNYYSDISGTPDGSFNNIPNDFFINNLNNQILFKEFKGFIKEAIYGLEDEDIYLDFKDLNPFVIYDICDNAYYKLDFIEWRAGGGYSNINTNSLAFKYNRTRIKARFDINSDWYQEIIQNNNILPILELSGNTNITFGVNTEYIEPGYIAYHPLLGVITSNVTISSNLNTSVGGSYTITYTITDYPGPHSVSKTRTINIVNPPTISLTGNTTVYVMINTNYNEPGYSAYDDDLGDITNSVIVSNNIDTSTQGTYSIYYSVSNSYITTTVYRTIIVTTDYIINSFSDLFNISDTISVTINVNNYLTGDEISQYVKLTRENYGGIYNLAKGETSFDQSISTKGVQWYSGSVNNDLNFNNISNDWFSNNNWESFNTYKNYNGIYEMNEGNPWIIYDMSDNAYYKIDFNYWAVGSDEDPQGFSYTRTNVPARFSS